jgi:GxxExxY protein
MEIDEITGTIVDSAMKVHTAIGPGLLEGVYGICLAHELQKRGLRVEQQVLLPVHYDGIEIPTGYRLDLLVEGLVVVELKSVDAVLNVHRAQLLSYLRMSRKTVGLLINFNVTHLKDGISRIVNSHHWTRAAAAN